MKNNNTFLAALAAVLQLSCCGDALAVTRMAARPAASAAPLLMAAPLRAPDDAELRAAIEGAQAKHGLDPAHGYRITARHPAGRGSWVTRYAHTYKGVRILGSESVLVSDGSGKVVGETMKDLRRGLGQNNGQSLLAGNFAQFDVTPALAPEDAVQAARGRAPLRIIAEAAPASAELVIYPQVRRQRGRAARGRRAVNAKDMVEQLDGYQLAYLVKIRSVGVAGPLFRDAIVSARDGHVIAHWNTVQTVTGVGYSQYNGQVRLSTAYEDGSYWLKDPLRGKGGAYGANTVTDAAHGGKPGQIYMRTFNSWGDGQDYQAGWPTLGENGQTAAVNAMWGMMNTYDTLKNVLGWSSLDGQDTATYISVHAWDGYDNAYYDDHCRCMYIGDGGTKFYNLGSVDVIAHEMGHGVTAATAGLWYFLESGGLNESASDINGEMTEAYARAGASGSVIPASGNDWMIGREVTRSGEPLRWMIKPSKDGKSPDAWYPGIGNLDVHYSSGPNNRMFYFLSQGSSADPANDAYSAYLTRSPRAMTGIGNDKAYRIWFRALTTKFTEQTDYADARDKVLEAATELYGPASPEAIAVQRAYAAINVGSDVDEPGAGVPLSITAQPQGQTVPAGASATFTVAAAGGSAPYAYQWQRNGADIGGATRDSFTLTAQAQDDGAQFAVRITDAAARTVTSAPALLAVTAGGPAELVANGSFEAGTAAWGGATAVIGNWDGRREPAYDGQQCAYLGGNGRLASELLTQAISIPAGASSATLSFALHIDTAEVSKAVGYDRLAVEVRNAAGTVLATLATYSNLDAAPGYQVRSADLSAFRGQNVVLSFTMTEDISLQTSFLLDRVSVVAR